MRCPTTKRLIPPNARRIQKGATLWVLCPWCDNGDPDEPGPQPHPVPGPGVLIALEGNIEYRQFGQNIYRALPGCAFKHYCWAPLWEQSQAARRLRGEFDRRPSQQRERLDVEGDR